MSIARGDATAQLAAIHAAWQVGEPVAIEQALADWEAANGAFEVEY